MKQVYDLILNNEILIDKITLNKTLNDMYFILFKTNNKHKKYGDNYEQVIQNKWLKRKLDRKLPIKNIKDKKSKI